MKAFHEVVDLVAVVRAVTAIDIVIASADNPFVRLRIPTNVSSLPPRGEPSQFNPQLDDELRRDN